MILFSVILGFSIEIGLAAYVVLLTYREKKSLRRMVSRARENFLGAVDALVEPHRRIARRLAAQIAKAQDFDDALLDAVVEATREPFKRPLWIRLLVGAFCSFTFLAPASYGLTAAALEVVTAWNEAQTLDRSLVYLRGQTELERPFSVLREGFQGSALLFVGLAFLWALAWYLWRPEVREARLVRAMLEGAALASPKSAAPATGRLSELIAPDRGLARPLTALVFCLCGITAGWLVLYQAADVRAANEREPVFSVWPTKEPIYTVTTKLLLPSSRAGRPIKEPPPPSLVIGQEKVTLVGDHLVDLLEGRLPEDWRATLDETSLGNRLGKSERLVILAHRTIELDVVMQLIQFFREKQIQRFDLLVERTVETGAPGGRKLQAALALQLGAAKEVGLHIGIADTGVRLSPNLPLESYEKFGWQQDLSQIVREKKVLLRNTDPAAVEIDLEGSRLTYDRFIEVLSAADSACIGTKDCGLPGLGLLFAINPTVPSP